MPVFKVVTRYSRDYQGKIPEHKYHDDQAIPNVVNYVLDPNKTEPKLTGGFGVNPFMAADQFEIVARNYGKDFGIRLRHMVLSFSDQEKVDVYQARGIAYRIAAYYGAEYQIFFAVHTDAAHINIHFVMNSVSYRTGQKYGGEKSDYYRFLDYMRSILREYGLQLWEQRD